MRPYEDADAPTELREVAWWEDDFALDLLTG
jgi:hypothetical protein